MALVLRRQDGAHLEELQELLQLEQLVVGGAVLGAERGLDALLGAELAVGLALSRARLLTNRCTSIIVFRKAINSFLSASLLSSNWVIIALTIEFSCVANLKIVPSSFPIAACKALAKIKFGNSPGVLFMY